MVVSPIMASSAYTSNWQSPPPAIVSAPQRGEHSGADAKWLAFAKLSTGDVLEWGYAAQEFRTAWLRPRGA